MDQKSKVYWTPIAEYDLDEIKNYISLNSPRNAEIISQKIIKKIELLKIFPSQGRIISELEKYGITEYRELIEQRWRIMYMTDNNEVYIIAIWDSSRNIEELIIQRLNNMNQ